MKIYKVLGRKMFDYIIEVEAETEEEAYDKASEAETHNWSNIPNDDVIEPVEVVEVKLSLDKDNDDWPILDSGIVVGA
jgi:hypothetical protein